MKRKFIWNRDAGINLFILSFLFSLGILTGVFLEMDLMFYLSLLGFGLVLVVVIEEKWWKAAVVVFLGIILACLRFGWLMNVELKLTKDILVDQEVAGRVVSMVEEQGLEKSFLLENRLGLIKVKLFSERELGFNDLLRIRTDLMGNSSEDNLNWRARLLKDGVRWTAGGVILQKWEKSGINLLGMVFWLRKNLLEVLERIMSEPFASLAGGILIGQRSTIAAGILKDFQIVGLTHILAISGFNVTLIINLLIFFLAGTGRWWRLGWAGFLIAIFVILTGSSASVLRAAVMGILIFLVKIIRRKTSVFKAILLSSFLIVWFKPLYWNVDLSFQLSAFATLSLILFSEDFVAGNWGIAEFVKEGVMVTLAAQVLTLPLMFYSFGRVSLIAPLANLLVGPLVPLSMLFSTMALFAGIIWTGGGVLMAVFCNVIFQLMILIAHYLAMLPLAQIEIGQNNLWLAMGWYIGIFMLFRRRKQGPD